MKNHRAQIVVNTVKPCTCGHSKIHPDMQTMKHDLREKSQRSDVKIAQGFTVMISKEKMSFIVVLVTTIGNQCVFFLLSGL